jgi:hypothetical protein
VIERHGPSCVKAFASRPTFGWSNHRSTSGALSRLHCVLRSDARQHAPSGVEWLYDTKLDGYRAQLHLHDGKVTVYSREGFNWTSQFSDIADAGRHLPARQAIIGRRGSSLAAPSRVPATQT